MSSVFVSHTLMSWGEFIAAGPIALGSSARGQIPWKELDKLYKKVEARAKRSKSIFGEWYIIPKMSMKTKLVTFRIKRSPRTKQFRCVVMGGNGEPTYVGEPCKNKIDVANTIFSHIEAIQEGRYVVRDDEGNLLFYTRGWRAPKKLLKKIKKRPSEGKLNRSWP